MQPYKYNFAELSALTTFSTHNFLVSILLPTWLFRAQRMQYFIYNARHKILPWVILFIYMYTKTKSRRRAIYRNGETELLLTRLLSFIFCTACNNIKLSPRNSYMVSWNQNNNKNIPGEIQERATEDQLKCAQLWKSRILNFQFSLKLHPEILLFS